MNKQRNQPSQAAIANVNSPTKAIQTQLASTTIGQQPVARPVQAQADPFGGSGGGGGNLFNVRAPRPPATKAEKKALRTGLTLYPCQAEMKEGEAAYLNQLRAWPQVNGDSNVSRTTGFPLREEPHRLQVNATTCGRTGHRRVDCQAMGPNKIPQLEATFRAICGSILGQPTRRTAQVNCHYCICRRSFYDQRYPSHSLPL